MKKLLSVLLTFLLIAGTVVLPTGTVSADEANYELGAELVTNGDFSASTVNTKLGVICGHNTVTLADYITRTKQNYGKWFRPTGGVALEDDAYENGTTTPTTAGEYPVYFKQNDTVLAQPDNDKETVLRVGQSTMQYVNALPNKIYRLSFRYRIGGLASFYAKNPTKANIKINLSSFIEANQNGAGTGKVASTAEALLSISDSGYSVKGNDQISIGDDAIVIVPNSYGSWQTAEIIFKTGDKKSGTTADYDSNGDGTLDSTIYPMLSFMQDVAGTNITVSEKAYLSNAFYLDDVSLKEVTYLTDCFADPEVYDAKGNKLALNDLISTTVSAQGDNYVATLDYSSDAGLTFKGWYKDGVLFSDNTELTVPTTSTDSYVPRFETKNLAYNSASFESYGADTNFRHENGTTTFPTDGKWGGIKTAGYRGQTVAGTFYDNQGVKYTQTASGGYSDTTTVKVSTDYAYSGKKSLYFSGAAWAFGSAIENVVPGKTYILSYRIKRSPTATDRTHLKATAVTTTLNIGNGAEPAANLKNHICNLYDYLALSVKKNIDLSSDGWELVNMEFTVPAAATDLTTVYLIMDSSGNGATTVNQFYLDDIVVLEKVEKFEAEIPVVYCDNKGTVIDSPNSYGEVLVSDNGNGTANLTLKYDASLAYSFMGWYDKDNNLVSKETTISNVSAADAANYVAKIKNTNIYTAASYEGYKAGDVLTHTDSSVNFPINGQWGGFAWAGYAKRTVAGTIYDNKGKAYTQTAGGSFSNGVSAKVTSDEAHSGEKSLLISGKYWTMVSGITGLEAGKTYNFSFWAKKDSTPGVTQIKGIALLTTVNVGQSGSQFATHITELYNTLGLPWDNGKYYQSAVDISSGDWVKIATQFTLPEEATDLDTVYLSIDASGADAINAGSLYIDDFTVSEVYETVTTAYNNAAAIRTASASSTGKNGLRIYNKINKDFINNMNITEYGSIVAKTSDLTGALTLDTTNIAKGVSYNADTLPSAKLWESTDKDNVFTSYLTGIPEIYYDDEFTVRAYAISGSGEKYYGEPINLCLYDVVNSIDNGNGLTAQTAEDVAAFKAFAGGNDKMYTAYDKWLKKNLTFAGKLRNIEKAPDTLSGAELTKALEVDGYYEPFFERAIANEGNLALLKAMFEKAERGEDITIVGFGGSITQKAACTNELDSYSHLVAAWMRKKFPNIKVNWYNAGIGSTTSVLGIARMQDHVLAYNPDLVILDFTTNDQTNDYHAGSYESILRTLYQKEIAVVTIAFGNVNNNEYKADGTCHRGSNREDLHGPVMLYNNVPVIDYYGVMWDCYLDADGDGYNIDSDAAHWKTLWADYIHPSVIGHKLAGNAINYYLNKVYEKLDSIDDTLTYPAIPLDEYTENFMGSMMYGNANVGTLLTDSSKVTTGSYNNYDSTTVSNWTIWKIEQGGYIEFTVDKCKMFALMSINSPDNAVAGIYINDTLVTTHTASRASGELNWMNFIRFFDGNETVKIKIACTSGTYRVTAALIAK